MDVNPVLRDSELRRQFLAATTEMEVEARLVRESGMKWGKGSCKRDSRIETRAV